MEKRLLVFVLALCMLLSSVAHAESAEVVVEVGTATFTLPAGFAYDEERSAATEAIIYSDAEGCAIAMQLVRTDDTEEPAPMYRNAAGLSRALGYMMTGSYENATLTGAGECAALVALTEQGQATAMILNRYEIILVIVSCESAEDAVNTLSEILYAAQVPETPLQ